MDTQNNDMNTGTNQQTPQNTPTDNQQNPQGAEAQGNQNQQTPQDNNPSGGTLLSGAGKATGAPDTYDFTASLPEGMELDQDTADSFGELARGRTSPMTRQTNWPNLAMTGRAKSGKPTRRRSRKKQTLTPLQP